MRRGSDRLRGGAAAGGACCARLALAAMTVWAAAAEAGRAQEQQLQTQQPPASQQRIDEQQPLEEASDAASVVDLLFEDFGVVVTAGRTAQPANMTGVPISVITAADLHFGGFSTVVDALFFAPGVDALAVDRNRFAVGVRGLHQEFSDRTLFLIDGRNASNALFGGVDFERLPLFVEDLARIEIGRGPGGAVWGANAFNGVVNFIRKRPHETLGALASVTVDEFGDAYSQLRWGAEQGALAWRLSFGYDQEVSSEDAISGDDFDSRDFSRVFRFDSEAEYRFSASSSLRFGASHVHIVRGDFPFLVFQPGLNERIDSTTAHAQYEWGEGEDQGGVLQWYGTFEDVNRPTLWRYSSADNSLEGSLRFVPAEGHEAMVGAALRLVRIRTRR
ncbi:MAG: TonB-dependent receptor, partial [Planctomycetota bacterium]